MYKDEIKSIKSFIDCLQIEFTKELLLLKDIMFEQEKDESNREELRNRFLIFKFLIGSCFNNILHLEYMNITFESDYSVKIDREKIKQLNGMYYDGTAIVKGVNGQKLANKIGAKFNTGSQLKNQKVISKYMESMIEYDKRKNPEGPPDYTGRTIGGDLTILLIRNNSVKEKRILEKNP